MTAHRAVWRTAVGGLKMAAFWGSAACGAPDKADTAALQTADTGGDGGGLHCAGGIVPLAAHFACACSRPPAPPTPPRPPKGRPEPPDTTAGHRSHRTEARGGSRPRGRLPFHTNKCNFRNGCIYNYCIYPLFSAIIIHFIYVSAAYYMNENIIQ